MKNKLKLISIIVAIALVFTWVSAAVIIEHEHEHTGTCTSEQCQICYQYTMLKNTLKYLSFILIAPLIFASFSQMALDLKRYLISQVSSDTLVSLKAKLSN